MRQPRMGKHLGWLDAIERKCIKTRCHTVVLLGECNTDFLKNTFVIKDFSRVNRIDDGFGILQLYITYIHVFLVYGNKRPCTMEPPSGLEAP